MATDPPQAARQRRSTSSDREETESLLSKSPSTVGDLSGPLPDRPIGPPRRQSSFAQKRPDGTPRTPNRVRFDIEDQDFIQTSNGHILPLETWVDDDDPASPNGHVTASQSQRLPLLTGIEAPTVALANDLADNFNAEEHLESARPKSGMKSAFMNMANSIIGAGIIGQPYAFRQAGLVSGIFLLVALTITVDWTIRLIVINSKLSGANSFQATVEHCFGKSGLIAISIAQWAFAYGGMVAFCIIIGDTIPQVMAYLFPSLDDMPFLWLLTDRRAMIVVFVLGISYPLTLYRDVAKLARASTLALLSMLVILITVITQGARAPPETRGELSGSLFINSGIFQAIGVISFAFVCRLSMLACLAMALAGFLAFGDKTQGNVLNNFPTNNLMVNIARLCFGLNMLTTLPLECFVCREVMNNYFFPSQPYNSNRHLIISTALVVSSMALSLITCDLGVVFELIGATSACALAYILPPLCYLKLSSRKWSTMIAAGACVVFGCVVMGISLVMGVFKMIQSHGAPHTCAPLQPTPPG